MRHDAWKRWRVFRAQKKSYLSFLFLGAFCFFSLTAEVWSNDRPLILVHDNQMYFPVFQYLKPGDLHIHNGTLLIDYRSLPTSDGDWAVWPLNRWNSTNINKRAARFPSPPSRENWLGTDDRGRDILARILYGFRNSLTFAVMTWIFSAIFGLIIGATSGFLGGRVDLYLQRGIEVFSTIPQMLLLIYIISVFGPSLGVLVAASCVFAWIGIGSVVRAEALKTRAFDYVSAAFAMGASPRHVLLRHVLPNCLIPVVTFAPFTIVGNIAGLAALDYMGLGLPPPTASWGELMRQAEAYYTFAWWIALFPSLAMFLTLLALTFVGDGLRMAAQPSMAILPLRKPSTRKKILRRLFSKARPPKPLPLAVSR
jgi:microcin C transport system permease protein